MLSCQTGNVSGASRFWRAASRNCEMKKAGCLPEPLSRFGSHQQRGNHQKAADNRGQNVPARQETRVAAIVAEFQLHQRVVIVNGVGSRHGGNIEALVIRPSESHAGSPHAPELLYNDSVAAGPISAHHAQRPMPHCTPFRGGYFPAAIAMTRVQAALQARRAGGATVYSGLATVVV